MNKGFNYSPTLPQHESGGSQGHTRSLLSEGNITIPPPTPKPTKKPEAGA
ncbi:hypothetical protein [Neisseria elongata]|nr:hypothetical protein [Neisseria elongata]